MRTGENASSADWGRAGGSRVREQRKSAGSCVTCQSEPCADDWGEDYITLPCIEEDVEKFEEAEWETQEK